VTRSVHAAVLRSTALATGLAFAMGLVVGTEVWAKPKVQLPKPRPIARNVVPKKTAATPATNAAAKSSFAPRVLWQRLRRPQPPRWPPRRASTRPYRPHANGGASRDGRNLVHLAGRQGLSWENVIELIRKHKPDDATQLEATIADPGGKEAR